MTNGGFCLWPIRKKKKKERKRQRKKRRKTIKENGELTSFFLSRHRRKIKGRERRKRKKRILSLASSQTEEKGEEKGEKEKGGKRYKRMAYLPHSFPVGINGGFRGGALSSSSSFGAEEPADKDSNMQSIEQHVLNLIYPDLRENALLELSKKRELFLDLAPLLWNSFGTMTALLQEIVSIYPFLSPPNLTRAQSNRVCNALTLLQCVASHPDTRMLLLDAKIPLYLVPFLKTTSKSTPFEYLRLTSLGVFGSLVKVGDTEVISSVISTEIFPRCLHTMEIGSEPSKTVATFIVQQILLDDEGLDYICSSAERFFEVARFLGNMVGALAEQPSSGLLKLIIRCYLRLSDNQRACDALRNYLPNTLRDTTFSSCFHADPVMRRWLLQLIHNTSGNRVAR